jgi:hypothetical protein
VWRSQAPNARPLCTVVGALVNAPANLAIMHGSSFRGDGGKALLELASVMKELLGGEG